MRDQLSIQKQLQRLVGLILLWVTCFGAYAADVTPLTIDPAATQIDLSKSVELLEDPGGALTIDDVRMPDNAARFQPGSSSPGFTPSAYWLRIVVFNPTEQPLERWFDTGNRTLQEVDLYVLDSQGGMTRQSTGSTQRFSERPLPTATFAFSVSLPPHRTTQLLMRVRTTGYVGVSVTPGIWQPEAHTAKAAKDNFVWTMLLGIGLGLFIVNLMLYAYLKDISYLLYALSLASFVWAASSAMGGFGAAYEYFWPNMPSLEQSSWVLSILASGIFPVLFSMHLLDFRTRHQKLTRVIFTCMALTATAIGIEVLVTLLQIPNSTRFLHVAFQLGQVVWAPLYPCTMFGVLVDLRQGNRVAKFIVIAFAPVMMSVFFLAYQGNTGLPMSWDYSVAAAVWEWFVMATLLADRFSQEVKAKLGAQEALVVTLKQSAHELEDKVTLRTRELRQEQARTTEMLRQNKELLHNILPSDIADELSATGITTPVRHEEASVLFTDFNGFTQVASTMPAARMVAELNDVFAAFDDICDDCGVEKIKTIGDAYMAAAGLPKPCEDHAQRCVRAGLRMAEFVEQRNADSAFKWRLRVGIHSGPVIAGVVGKRKYAFDIWGDTVNIASRMESSGEPGKVNVSAYTYDLIRKDFACEYRGRVDAKGKGEVDMYFVIESRS